MSFTKASKPNGVYVLSDDSDLHVREHVLRSKISRCHLEEYLVERLWEYIFVPSKYVFVDRGSLMGVSVDHRHDKVNYFRIFDFLKELLPWIISLSPVVL